MMRWLKLLMLRRAQNKLQAEIQWLRDTIYTDTAGLVEVEARERAVQAELWCVESPRALLSDRDSGLSPGG